MGGARHSFYPVLAMKRAGIQFLPQNRPRRARTSGRSMRVYREITGAAWRDRVSGGNANLAPRSTAKLGCC